MTRFKMEEFRCRCCGSTGSPQAVENIRALVENVLDPARERYGEPIKVNSGYRCEKHNREVGGASQSQHLCQGGSAAADIAAVGLRGNDLALENLEIVRAIVKNGQWDQMILEDVPSTGIEPRWIHVSWKRQGGNRKEILKKVAGRKGYLRLSRLDMAQLMSE
ncbi:MAG: hypothetical protein IJK46_05095 [Prevotella sp.]|nr:hypothetical protein [Prevotella sp.]MBR0265782.1 hypothetical protein [Prevotella sp.]